MVEYSNACPQLAIARSSVSSLAKQGMSCSLASLRGHRNLGAAAVLGSMLTVLAALGSAQTAPIRVNAGGGTYTDPSGIVWSADTGFSTPTSIYNSAMTIWNTTTPLLYQTQRWSSGSLGYQLAVSKGTYIVTLKFAELYMAADQRVFDISLGNKTVEKSFDAAAQAGGPLVAIDKSYPFTTANGKLNITFTPVVGNPAVAGIVVVPALAPVTGSLDAGQTLQFTSPLTGGVTWTVPPRIGSISPTGIYSAPSSISSTQTVLVSATSLSNPALSASAVVTLNPTTAQSVSVSVTPGAATLGALETQQFSAAVTGTTNTAVNWTLNPGFGTISPTGLYTAPSSISSAQTVTVTATSAADPSKSASASVSLAASLSVTPLTTIVPASKSVQFAVVGNSGKAYGWTVNGIKGGNGIVGKISPQGVYTAPSIPPNPATATITAVENSQPSLTGQASVTVLPAVSISLSPANASLQVSTTQQFMATVIGTTNTAVNWSVNGVTGGNSTVGTVSTNGLYTAPASVPSGGSVAVTATSAADPTQIASSTASIAAPGVSVSISPTSASVQVSKTQQFMATVTGTTNTAVIWSVNGVAGGNLTLGTVSTSGLYAAPLNVPSGGSVAVTAASTAAPAQQATAVVTVTATAPSITTSSLPSGTTGVAYSATLAATGGTTPYSWSIISGLLPTGVGLGTGTGVLSGIPTTAGAYTVTVQSIDALGQTASKTLSLVIAAALSITTTSVPNGTVGTTYTATLAASGGEPPVTWSVLSGQLPTGLNLSSSGGITGTPTTAGGYAFVAQATDSAASGATQSYTVNVVSAVGSTLITDNFDRTSLGSNWTTAFGSMTIVNGAYASNKSSYPQDSGAYWNASAFSPNHYSQATLNLTDNTSYAGVLVRGGAGSGYFCYAAQQFLFLEKMVEGGETQLATSNSYTYQAGDVMRVDVYGSTIRCLINGNVKFSVSDGELTSGYPGIAGTFATHTNTGDNWSADNWTGLPLVISTVLLPDSLINTPYGPPAFTLSGGMSPFTWSVASGQLPAGLSLDAKAGTITGVPTTLGTSTFTIEAADSSSPQKTATKAFMLNVNQNDSFGGSTAITGTVTGNWHTQVINGRWWIIDPLGNALHFTAPYNVGRGDGGILNGSTMAARINAKYGSTDSNWVCSYFPTVASRLKTWKFTGIGGGSDAGMTPLGQNSCWGFDSVLGGYYMPQTYRMPTVFYYQTSAYAMTNEPQTYPIRSVSPLDQPVKNINYGLNSYIGYGGYIPGAGEPDYSDTRLSQYFDYLIPTNTASYFSAPPAIQSYIVGASIDEADQMYSFATGGRNPAFSTGWDHSHGGLRALRTSPLQYANRTKSVIYPDGNVYVKSVALRSYLKGLYGTIAALNAAWGSAYSACDIEGAGDEFGSCGTKVSNELFATADGTSSSYTHTLTRSVPSWHSIAVYVNGTMVAGDLAYNGNDSDIYAAPGSAPSAPSKLFGPLIETSSSATNFINYTSATGLAGTVGIAFKTGSGSLASVSGNGSTVTVKTQRQHGTWPGAHVTITGTTNYNLTGVTIASVVNSYTFTISAPNAAAAELDSGTVSFNDAAPPKGALITVSYVVNGWGIGNGLMDEDGRHSNCLGASNNGANAVQLNLCKGGIFANSQIAIDLDGVLGIMATDYFSNMNAVFGKHFGNGLNRRVLNLGPDPLIYSVSPPAPGVLQAAGLYTDVIAIASYTADGSTFYQMTQEKLDYIRQYAGDKPLLNADFLTAEANSALKDFAPTSGAQNFATQEARGSAYLSLMQLLTSSAYTIGGNKPYIGTQFWQWTDSLGEKLNWGLTTPHDNAYDGHEDVTSTVTCSAPNATYACGGEQSTSGDFITGVTAANSLWLPK